MKTHLTYFVAAVLLSNFTFAQEDSTKVATRIEAFSKRKSRLLHKVEYTVGNSKAVEVNILTIRDMVAESVERGIVLEWDVSRSYTVDIFRTYLDSDEVEDLIKVVTKLISIIKANVQESYTEYVFSTRGGFKIAIFSEVGKPWTASIENSRVGSHKFFKLDELEKLNQSLIVGRDRIK